MNQVEMIKALLEMGATGVLVCAVVWVYNHKEAVTARYMTFLEKQNQQLLTEDNEQ